MFGCAGSQALLDVLCSYEAPVWVASVRGLVHAPASIVTLSFRAQHVTQQLTQGSTKLLCGDVLRCVVLCLPLPECCAVLHCTVTAALCCAALCCSELRCTCGQIIKAANSADTCRVRELKP